ncbi:MAG: hypothetical protein ACRELC_12245, partial [Gemmatimonadota bacterium]
YGGEEMAVLLPKADLAGAVPVAERLREAIEAASSLAPGERAAAFATIIGAWEADLAAFRRLRAPFLLYE